MGNKLHLSQQAAPMSPNAEELSLILGSMARGRSFSTTVSPKVNEVSPPSATASTTTKERGTSVSSMEGSVVRRKKSSTSQTPKEKDATAEEFFIEIIIQRHARRLLQDKKLEALGYMSASLDFHLVGWLQRETDRAARIEDFVATLKQLHEDFDWPKPSLDLRLHRRQSDKSAVSNPQESPSYSLQSLRLDTNMGTGDSGYTSLPAHPHYESIQNEQTAYINSFSLPPEGSDPFLYNPEISSLALQNINLGRFNELGRISEEGDARSSQPKYNTTTPSGVLPAGRPPLFKQDAFRRESSSTSLLGETEAKLLPMDSVSCISEQVSLWGDDQSYSLNQDVDNSFEKNLETLASQSSRQVCHKLEVKTRYLLQIFTEASCFDFALLLSIILMDAASISRITNSAIRSGSLAICRQLRNGLKDITRWSFQEW